jgi:hypothetical protein
MSASMSLAVRNATMVVSAALERVALAGDVALVDVVQQHQPDRVGDRDQRGAVAGGLQAIADLYPAGSRSRHLPLPLYLVYLLRPSLAARRFMGTGSSNRIV